MSALARPWPTSYVDPIGRAWTVEKLDALLSDFAVRARVQDLYGIGYVHPNGFSPGKVYAWASKRYRRQEVAALLLVLVTRHRDQCRAQAVGGAP